MMREKKWLFPWNNNGGLTNTKNCTKAYKNIMLTMLVLKMGRGRGVKLKSAMLPELQMKAWKEDKWWKCEYEKVREALFLCLIQQREKGIPITQPLPQEKTLIFHKSLIKENPTAQLVQAGYITGGNVLQWGSPTYVQKHYQQIWNGLLNYSSLL